MEKLNQTVKFLRDHGILNPEIGNSYCGHYNSITSAIHLKGLEQGIYEIYESIINR